MLSSVVFTVWLIARHWTPFLFHPIGLAALLLLWLSHPIHYTMFLIQTHALFFLLSIAAIILAERPADLNLPQQVHDLLRSMLLASCHRRLLPVPALSFLTGTELAGHSTPA